MKRELVFFSLAAFLAQALLLSSCDRLGSESDPSSGKGKLNIAFVNGGELFTRTFLNLPDTSDFLLEIKSSSGDLIYDGKFGDCPESLEVSSGTYMVKTISEKFTKPAFSSPQFGDEQCVIVPDNGVVNVRLICRQINSGVKLDISPDFLTQCPDAVLFLKSDEGRLMYSYSEKRTAYFQPGPVSLVMNTGSHEEVLFVRELAEREILTIGVSVISPADNGNSSLSVSVDTTRIWSVGNCIIGSTDSGTDVDEAMSVSDARDSVGEEDIWVCGYIVGGDLTSASASYSPPFRSATNLLLGPRSSTRDRKVCISVQLPDGDVREGLNLADNPGLLGRRIAVKGDIVNAYYGIPGIKNTTEYKLL